MLDKILDELSNDSVLLSSSEVEGVKERETREAVVVASAERRKNMSETGTSKKYNNSSCDENECIFCNADDSFDNNRKGTITFKKSKREVNVVGERREG